MNLPALTLIEPVRDRPALYLQVDPKAVGNTIKGDEAIAMDQLCRSVCQLPFSPFNFVFNDA